MKLTRRDFLKLTGATAGAAALSSVPLLGPVKPGLRIPGAAHAVALGAGGGKTLSDPALQPKFAIDVPNALDPAFKYQSEPLTGMLRRYNGVYSSTVKEGTTLTGLEDSTGSPVTTSIYGYSDDMDALGPTWPGKTIEVVKNGRPVRVTWNNGLPIGDEHLLPVDTSLHWAYSLTGYTDYSIKDDGVPIITHVHGGHSDFQYDGNPEFFYNPGGTVVGPRWADVPGGFTTTFEYDANVSTGTIWYHDHALGLTRLNVYAGLAGFFIVRDKQDTGQPGNQLNLPAYPYEMALAIQDRMFENNGALFYPAYPGDPFYADFIETPLLPPEFVDGGPTALAEFFGDHMLVNGKIWPKADVEPRNYRLRFLNGCDSRFLVCQFVAVDPDVTDPEDLSASVPLDFTVIGSDQGLASSPTVVDTLVIEPGGRYDLILDFKQADGKRVIMKNLGWDTPFGFDWTGRPGAPVPVPGEDIFEDRQTDRIMAFDVTTPPDSTVPDVSPTAKDISNNIMIGGKVGGIDRVRQVALFEGTDEFGRLQPILGTVGPATDYLGNPINWPDKEPYITQGLVGPMEGAIAWHSPTTENPALDSKEEWEVWNVTGDAHPVHLHLVKFEIRDRFPIIWHNNEEGFTSATPLLNPTGTYLMPQPVVQHTGAIGAGFKVMNPTRSTVPVPPRAEYVENAPKDMVSALPSEVTVIRAHFDKPGRYVWHCHILSHEDHEMMRVLHVGPGA